jgi:hypothetical protein
VESVGNFCFAGQVIKPASIQAANQKPSDGDNNNNVHDIGRKESSKVREHVMNDQ